jgi:hypothetical protein
MKINAKKMKKMMRMSQAHLVKMKKNVRDLIVKTETKIFQENPVPVVSVVVN